MAHLVTGFKGSEHIQAADDGSFNAAFFGSGQFVMEAGNMFEGSIVDNNTVRILDGDLLMYGRHIRINPETYEDMTITTGTAGKSRIDIICMTYEKNTSNGTEKAYLEVIEGTESEGQAVEPSIINGNILNGATKNQMPLYKVNINGVVLETITNLFTLIPTYKKLAENYAEEFKEACQNHLDSLEILDSLEEIDANTQEQQLAGALALQELHDEVNESIDDLNDILCRYTTITDCNNAVSIGTKYFCNGSSTVNSPDSNGYYLVEPFAISASIITQIAYQLNNSDSELVKIHVRKCVNGTFGNWQRMAISSEISPIDATLSTTSTNPVQNKVINTAITSLENTVNKLIAGDAKIALCRSNKNSDTDYAWIAGGQNATNGEVYLQSATMENGALNDLMNLSFDGNIFNLSGTKDGINKTMVLVEPPTLCKILSNSKTITNGPTMICSYTTPIANKYVDVTFDIHVSQVNDTGFAEFYLLKHMGATNSEVLVASTYANLLNATPSAGIHLGLSYRGFLDSALDYLILCCATKNTTTITTDYQTYSSNVDWVAM